MRGRVGHTAGMDGRFEVLDHTADTAVRVEAPSMEGLLVVSARAMFSLMFDLEGVETTTTRTMRVEAPTLEEMLVDWLSDLLSWSEIDRVAYFDVAETEWGGTEVRGRVRGAPIDDLTMTGPPIKAVTYHGLHIGYDESGWEATIVFDV